MTSKRHLTLEWNQLLGRENKNLDAFHNQIWRNIRPEGGFRLTQFGHEVLESIGIKSWTIKIKNTPTNTGSTLLAMDRFLDKPYYVDNRRHNIIVYDGDLATQLLLYDGDLANFLAAHNL